MNDVRAIERLRRIDFMGDVKSLTDDDVDTIKLVGRTHDCWRVSTYKASIGE